MNSTPTLLLSTCETCLHFRSVGDDATLSCVAHPPHVQMVAVPSPQGSPGGFTMNKVTMFPSPDPGWSCAEHRSRRQH